VAAPEASAGLSTWDTVPLETVTNRPFDRDRYTQPGNGRGAPDRHIEARGSLE